MIRLFQVSIPTSVMALVVLDAILVFSCFLGVTYLILGDGTEVYFRYENGLLAVGSAVATILLGLYLSDLYSELRVRSMFYAVQQMTAIIGVLLIVQAIIAYLTGEDVMLPRRVLILTGVLHIALFPVWRKMYTNVLYKGFGIDRLLFLGTDTPGTEIAEYFAERPQTGFVTVGFVDDMTPTGATIAGTRVLGPIAKLDSIVADNRPSRIVVNLADRRQSLPIDRLLDLRFSGIRIEEASVLFEQAFGRITMQRLRPSQLIFSAELGPKRWKMRTQTVYSFVIALIGLIVAGPIMILVALAIRLTSPGPILFRQTRVGFNGSHFTVYKFRSMVVDAEARTGAVWAQRNDPRVTAIGRFLRKTRLDELPQLFNIVRGHMSVVGPRPERPEFVTLFNNIIPFYRQRHAVKPGLTGWAQINYKYGESVEDTVKKLEYDLYYIKNLSPSLDFYIMFHTAKVMLFSSHGQ